MAEDVAKAIRWVCDRAGDYGGDAKRLLISGHSAGAQLAALLCTDSRYLTREQLSLAQVKGCIPVDGDTYDVPLQIETVEERVANIYRRKFGSPEQQRELSAVTHAARGKNIPPFLILHVADHPEVKLQSETLAEALRAAGVRAKAYPADGKNHLTINSELGRDYDKPTEVMFEFIERSLRQ
jgi:acetyl esterase/lipase